MKYCSRDVCIPGVVQLKGHMAVSYTDWIIVSGLFTTRTTVKARKLADISIGDNTGLELQSAWPRDIQRQRPTDLLKR